VCVARCLCSPRLGSALMHAVTRRSGCRTRVGAISMGMRPWLQSALMLASPWIDAQTLVDVLQYDGRGNILQRTTDGSAVVYLYDGLDRLRAEGALGGQTFELDPDGGRLADRRSHYRVLPGGQRLADRDGMALVHGPAGHLLADSAWRNGRWAQRSFDWTLAGQLKSVRIDGVLAATYLYNDARQRTRKTLAQPAAGEPAVTLYRHDPEGRLVMEVAGTAAQAPGIAVAPGQVLVRYVWQDAVPVAVVWPPMTPGNPNASTDRIVYLHVDHLNTPRRASDDRGVVVWQWQSDAFGERPPDEDADRDGRRTTINLRFPGQYFDAESGLHYNWHRYYDPQVGRYTQVDPIGLAGGLNAYAYVGGNPLMYTDPYGLWALGDPLPQGLVDFSAGLGDSISFGLTGYARSGLGIGGVNKCSGFYRSGELADLAFETSTLGLSTGLKALAANASRAAARNGARPYVNAFREAGGLEGGFVHHSNPLFGHPGGIPTTFPTGGLPYAVNSGAWNLRWFADSASHSTAHRWMRRLENAWGGFVNPGTTGIRAARDAADACTCHQ